jgi:hypothetical protein
VPSSAADGHSWRRAPPVTGVCPLPSGAIRHTSVPLRNTIVSARLPAHVLSAPTGWYAGLADGDRLWLVDATMDGTTPDPWSLRRHCTHELAFAALLALSERFTRAGDRHGSAKAALLRSRLPLKRA